MLKMAKTKEKRDIVKWLYTRRFFFGWTSDYGRPCERVVMMARGLKLARDCDHEDARFLASLFSEDAPVSVEAARAVFLANGDPRCLYWATRCGAQPMVELRNRSAEGGYSWALSDRSIHEDATLNVALL